MTNLILNVFEPKNLAKGDFYMAGEFFTQTKKNFPKYIELTEKKIKKCVCFFKKSFSEEKVVTIKNITNLKVEENKISFKYEFDEKLDIKSGDLKNALLVKEKAEGWFENDKYINVYYFNSNRSVDEILDNAKTISTKNSLKNKILNLKSKKQWDVILSLVDYSNGMDQNNGIWNRADLLYEIGFAACKLSEMETNVKYPTVLLKEKDEFRKLSEEWYKRCYELNDKNYRYPAALAYRYNKNYDELIFGLRKDGNSLEEYSKAKEFYEKALNIMPENLKINYNLSKLLLKRVKNSWNIQNRLDGKERYLLEKEAEEHLKNVEKAFKKMTDDKKQYFKKELISSYYLRGNLHLKKVDNCWLDYVCARLQGIEFDGGNYMKYFLYNAAQVAQAKNCYESCYKTLVGVDMGKINIEYILNKVDMINVNPIDLLYKLGLIYTHNVFNKKFIDNDNDDLEYYTELANYSFDSAKELADRCIKKGLFNRDVGFIYEKSVWVRLLRHDVNNVDMRISECTGYVENTYALVLILQNEIDEGIEILKSTANSSNFATKKIGNRLLKIAKGIKNEGKNEYPFLEEEDEELFPNFEEKRSS